MAKKTPKKDINLYALVAGPKQSTVKKGALFTVIGIVAVLLLGGGFAGVKVYALTQEKLVAELEQKTNDPELQEKLSHVNELAQDIATLRSAGNAYATIREEIDYQARSNCDDFTIDLVEKLVSCETYHVANSYDRIATITAISYDGQTLQITANSENSRYVSFFVSNLTQLGLFSDVSYSSYTLTDNAYTYVVSAVFNEHIYEDETEDAAASGEAAQAEEGTTQ